jgi:ComF family protein
MTMLAQPAGPTIVKAVMVVGGGEVSTKLSNRVANWLNIIQFWLLPGCCVLCRQPSGQPFDLCESCHEQLRYVPQACQRCALALPRGSGRLCRECVSEDSPFSQALAPLTWAEPTSLLVSRYKYQQQLACGRVLGQLLLHELRLHYAGQPLPELILPVPLHPARLQQRGYNQSLLLARQLGRGLGLPCRADLLLRLRNTQAQQSLDRAQRLQNLQGAFALAPGAAPRMAGLRRIALVDDVVTTLSTARAVAAVLQSGLQPAPELHLWALARA